MFEVKLYQVISSRNVLSYLIEEKLSAVTARLLRKYHALVEKEYTDFQKINEIKCKEYGEEIEDENKQKIIKVKDENMSKYSEEINELLSQPVQIHLKRIIVDEKFPDITAHNYALIEWMLEDAEEKL